MVSGILTGVEDPTTVLLAVIKLVDVLRLSNDTGSMQFSRVYFWGTENANGVLAKPMAEALEYVNSISAAPSADEATDAFTAWLESEIGPFNFMLGETGTFSSLPKRAFGTYPSEWLDVYKKRGYLHSDPVTVHSRKGMSPFEWSDISNRSNIGKNILRQAANFDLDFGFCFPVANAGRYSAALSIAGPNLSVPESLVGKIHLAALYFHGRCISLSTRVDSNEFLEKMILSPREIECLKWVAGGKTDWEIGEILRIAESTVHSYVESAKRRLDCVSRTQAVVEAIRLGLLAI